MKQPKSQRTIGAMIAAALLVVIIAAVASTFVQQLLFGQTRLPVTVAVLIVSLFFVRRLFRKSAA